MISSILSDNVEKTPLHIAALLGNLNTVKECIKRGDEVNFASCDGKTAAHYAAIGGNLEILKYLVESHANVNQRDNYGRLPLHYACAGDTSEQ